MTVRLANPRDVGPRGTMNKDRAAMVAARRIGITVEEYQARRASGEKWCSGCHAWHATSEFPIDRHRSDGYANKCREARKEYNRRYFYRATCEQCGGPRHAQGGRFCKSCYADPTRKQVVVIKRTVEVATVRLAAKLERQRISEIRALLSCVGREERRRKREERRIEDRWIRLAIRQQSQELRRLEKERIQAAREAERIARQAERRGAADARRGENTLLYEAVALDALGDVLSDPFNDPAIHLEMQELSQLLAGIDLEDVERMNEETLGWLRHKLTEAGYGPGRITTVERKRATEKRKERLARRSESRYAAHNKLFLPEDVKPEARGHAKLMKIAKQNQRRMRKTERQNKTA